MVRTAERWLSLMLTRTDAVKDRLVALEAAMTILKLSTAIYPLGSWQLDSTQESSEIFHEAWSLRSTLASWSWRAIEEITGDEDNRQYPLISCAQTALTLLALPEQPRLVFGPDALPLLVSQLRAFLPPYPELPAIFSSPTSRRSLVQTDFDIYEQVCGLIESLCLDVEDVRLSLARGLTFPDGEHGGVACLSELLTFVEKGDYPPHWASELPGERANKEKGFDVGKGALVKAIVEVAGEEKNTDTLWDDSEVDMPGGVFVSRMVEWIRTHKSLKEGNRDDLIICATLSLGNICRRGMLRTCAPVRSLKL